MSRQVPQDEWGGYPGGGKDDEIPCRRMRSSSYVKAMGDEESGESDSSPKTSPQKSVRPDALVKAIIRPRDLLDSQRSLKPLVQNVWSIYHVITQTITLPPLKHFTHSGLMRHGKVAVKQWSTMEAT